MNSRESKKTWQLMHFSVRGLWIIHWLDSVTYLSSLIGIKKVIRISTLKESNSFTSKSPDFASTSRGPTAHLRPTCTRAKYNIRQEEMSPLSSIISNLFFIRWTAKANYLRNQPLKLMEFLEHHSCWPSSGSIKSTLMITTEKFLSVLII